MIPKRLIPPLVLLILCCNFLTTPSSSAAATENELLLKRVEAYWSALTHSDWPALYALLPQQESSKITLDQFISRQTTNPPFKCLSFSIIDSDIDGQSAWVYIDYKSSMTKYPGMPPHRARVWTLWTKEAENWYPLSQGSLELPPLPPKMRALPEEIQLTTRIDEYWKAVELQDWATLYKFLLPSYRAQVTLEEFLQKKAMNLYTSHKIYWVMVTAKAPAVGSCRISIAYRPNDPSLSKLPPQARDVMEDWIKEDGEWFRKALKEE